MFRRFNIPFVLLLTVLSIQTAIQHSYSQESAVTPDLSALKAGHPRLLFHTEDIERLKNLIKDDAVARMIYNDLYTQARKIMEGPTVKYEIVGPRLLTQSRNCLQRVANLALLYRLDKKPEHLERAKKELFTAAEFKDWNPSHFLDTAEMAHAFALGYDWLYDDLSNEERNVLRTAMIEKGLKPYLEAWEKDAGWTRTAYNWNQVCNGGIGIAALALADVEPELAAQVLRISLNALPKALHEYAPDGGWDEGPGYWHYATRYTVYFLSALETAMGTDYGLSQAPGFDKAGDFRIHFTSPLDLSFNYADGGATVGNTHELFWLAKRFNRPDYAWYQREHLGSPSAWDLIWFRTEGSEQDAVKNLPLDAFYQGVQVGFLRSSWTDPNALFVGFKGGDNKANHAHLDLGSFVLDCDGVRWAVDLGADDYNLPDYFSNDTRWTYFRNNTFSHNTLVINDDIQDPKAAAQVTKWSVTPDQSQMVVDLSAAYTKHANKVIRGVFRIKDRHVLIQDEVTASSPVQVEWNLLTEADVEIQNNRAILKQDGKQMNLQIWQPENARFITKSANPPQPEKQNTGVTRLVAQLPEKVSQTRIVVLFSPAGEKIEIDPGSLDYLDK